MRIVICADQSANYSEMATLLRALIERGHTCNFIFPVNDKRDVVYARELDELSQLELRGLLNKLTLVDLAAVAAAAHQLPQTTVSTPAWPLTGGSMRGRLRPSGKQASPETSAPRNINRVSGSARALVVGTIERLMTGLAVASPLKSRGGTGGQTPIPQQALLKPTTGSTRGSREPPRTPPQRLVWIKERTDSWRHTTVYRVAKGLKVDRVVAHVLRPRRAPTLRGVSLMASRVPFPHSTVPQPRPKPLMLRLLVLAVKPIRALTRKSWGRSRRMINATAKKIKRNPHFLSFVRARNAGDYMTRYYQSYLNGLKTELLDWNVDCVIVPEEVVAPFWSTMVGACKQAGVPIVVVPYTIANQQEAFESLKGVEAYQTSNNWFTARRYGKWRMKKGGFDIVRLPAAHILAHERLHLTPSDPWLMNSGNVDCVCVESPAIGAYFTRSGIAQRKIVVTGSASLDEIYSRQRQRDSTLERLREAGLSGEKPILLVGGCPNQLRGSVPRCEHKSIEEVVDFVATSLAGLRDRYDFLVRPHPSYLEMGDLFAGHGFRSTTIPTAELVSVCSLYVAFASATIRWAIACGIPTVNYDVFGYDYDEFKKVVGVFNVGTTSEFERAVTDLYPGSARYDEARRALVSAGSAWSMLDGRCMDRIETVLTDCVARTRTNVRHKQKLRKT